MKSGVNVTRDQLADELRFGALALFMRGPGWDESRRLTVAGNVADELLASGWIAEARQQPRCPDCLSCACQAVLP